MCLLYFPHSGRFTGQDIQDGRSVEDGRYFLDRTSLHFRLKLVASEPITFFVLIQSDFGVEQLVFPFFQSKMGFRFGPML